MQRQFLETSAHNTIKEFAKLDTAAQADPRTLQDATVTPLFFFCNSLVRTHLRAIGPFSESAAAATLATAERRALPRPPSTAGAPSAERRRGEGAAPRGRRGP